MSTIEENKVSINSVEVESESLLELLEGVSSHASKDKTLPVLNAVQVEGAGGDLIARATDRYRLISGAVRYREGELSPSLISLDDIKSVITLCKAHKANLVTITRVSDFLTISSLGDAVTFSLIRGDYPPTEYLFSNSEAEPTPVPNVAFNPLFMADYAKIAGKSASVQVYFTGKGKPMRVKISGDKITGSKITWRALLMPMRYTD